MLHQHQFMVSKKKKVTEQLSLEPISTYNKAKMIAERVLLSYKKAFKYFNHQAGNSVWCFTKNEI